MALLSNDSDYDLLPCVWRLFTSCTQWKFWDTQIWPLVLVFSAFPVGRKKASTKERFWTWKLNSCDVTLKCTKGLISPLLTTTSLSPTKAEHKYLSTSDWQFCLHTKKSWLKKECYQCYGMGISSNQWKWWDFLWCYFQSINEGGSKTLLG